MILQKTYHKLDEWIIMLNSPDFKGTDVELVQEEMKQLMSEIWLNRDLEFNDTPKRKREISWWNDNNSPQEKAEPSIQDSSDNEGTHTKDYGHKDLIYKDYDRDIEKEIRRNAVGLSNYSFEKESELGGKHEKV